MFGLILSLVIGILIGIFIGGYTTFIHFQERMDSCQHQINSAQNHAKSWQERARALETEIGIPPGTVITGTWWSRLRQAQDEREALAKELNHLRTNLTLLRSKITELYDLHLETSPKNPNNRPSHPMVFTQP